MTEINHSKIQYDLSQWKKVVDHAPGFATQHKNLVDLLDEKYLMEASADTKRSLLIALGQAAESYGLETIELELKGDQKAEPTETQSDHIDVTYIDEFMELHLKDKAKEQLQNIKNLLIANPNSTLSKDRLTVKDGFVVIDGFTLPVEVKKQEYKDMAAENSKQLYPDATIAFLNFTAEMTGKTFDRGTLNNKNLTDRSLSYEEILEILNTYKNKSILESLFTIMGKIDNPQYIPMGIDSNGYVMYANLRPVYLRFLCGVSHFDDNCLVPSRIGG